MAAGEVLAGARWVAHRWGEALLLGPVFGGRTRRVAAFLRRHFAAIVTAAIDAEEGYRLQHVEKWAKQSASLRHRRTDFTRKTRVREIAPVLIVTLSRDRRLAGGRWAALEAASMRCPRSALDLLTGPFREEGRTAAGAGAPSAPPHKTNIERIPR